jgi:hypothetical protein
MVVFGVDAMFREKRQEGCIRLLHKSSQPGVCR